MTEIIIVNDAELDWRYFAKRPKRRCRVRKTSTAEFLMLRARYDCSPPPKCCYFTVVWRAKSMLHKQYFLALCQLNTGMSDEEAQGFYHAIKQLMDDDCEPWDCPPPYLELAG